VCGGCDCSNWGVGLCVCEGRGGRIVVTKNPTPAMLDKRYSRPPSPSTKSSSSRSTHLLGGMSLLPPAAPPHSPPGPAPVLLLCPGSCTDTVVTGWLTHEQQPDQTQAHCRAQHGPPGGGARLSRIEFMKLWFRACRATKSRVLPATHAVPGGNAPPPVEYMIIRCVVHTTRTSQMRVSVSGCHPSLGAARCVTHITTTTPQNTQPPSQPQPPHPS